MPPAPLITGSLLARNTLWSILGQFVSMLAAFVAIPHLVHGLGTERFGVIAIIWSVIGYFGLLDFGLARSLIQSVAERLGSGRADELAPLVWTSLSMMFALSVAGAVLIGLASPWIVERWLDVPPPLQDETRRAFQLLAVSLPAVVGSAGLAGVLAAHQRFLLLTTLRAPLSVLSFVAPLAVLPFSTDLSWVVAVIVAVRFLGWLLHAIACARILPELRRSPRWVGGLARPLLHTGGWISVINLAGPILVSLDRFWIGAWVPLAAVAYYGTCQEIATKLWFVPGTVMSVLFPAFAAIHQVDHERLRQLFVRGLKYVYLVLFPIALILVALAGEVLHAWLGREFAQHGRFVLQVLAIGVFVNGLAYVPSGLLQAIARPRAVALFLLAQVPFYLLALWWWTRDGGIRGASLAWLARALADLVGLLFLVRPSLGGGSLRGLAWPTLVTAVVFGAALAVQPLASIYHWGFLIVTLGAFGAWAWSRGLVEERRAMMTRLGLMR